MAAISSDSTQVGTGPRHICNIRLTLGASLNKKILVELLGIATPPKSILMLELAVFGVMVKLENTQYSLAQKGLAFKPCVNAFILFVFNQKTTSSASHSENKNK